MPCDEPPRPRHENSSPTPEGGQFGSIRTTSSSVTARGSPASTTSPARSAFPYASCPPATTSFTWVDSITALGLGLDLGVPQPQEPWKRALHQLDQLDLMMADSLAPDIPVNYEGHQKRLLDHYVEIQLWADEPIARYLIR